MTALVQDLRHAVRVLLGAKAWTLVILLSLALGIEANTALFTAVNGLLLQTVSVPEPERLVRFNHAGRNDMVRNSNDYGNSGTSGTRNVRSTFSFPMIEQLRAANTTLTGLAAGAPMGSLNVLVNGDAQLATGYQATGNYFAVIGVSAVLVKKAKRPASAARTAMLTWRDAYPLSDTSSTVMINAADLAAGHHLGIWDSVIIAATAEAGCRLLLSEDLQEGFTWRGVTVTNPFAQTHHALLDALLSTREVENKQRWPRTASRSASARKSPSIHISRG